MAESFILNFGHHAFVFEIEVATFPSHNEAMATYFLKSMMVAAAILNFAHFAYLTRSRSRNISTKFGIKY